MKRTALTIAAGFAWVRGIVLAQGADDPMAQLRACSLLERADRLECLDRLSRAAAPPAPSVLERDDWTISQTTSPVDGTPIATATTSSREVAGGAGMQLSIRCRGGRTELAVSGPAISGRAEDYFMSYRVNDGEPVQATVIAPAFSPGVAFKGNPVALLRSLPSEGEFAVHLSPRAGAARDGETPIRISTEKGASLL